MKHIFLVILFGSFLSSVAGETGGKNETASKVEKGFHKAVLWLTYLNYSDRPVDRPMQGVAPYEPFEGSIIRTVTIRILNPYGISLDHPDEYHPNKLQKFANSLQMHTREWAVKNDLQFREGEPVRAMNFADTEKLLWERGSFKDLRIILQPVDSLCEMVDVVILVRDRWSWSLSTNLEVNRITLGMRLSNFMGYPQSIGSYVSFNYRKNNFYTLHGGYGYNNIARSKVDVLAKYSYDDLLKNGRLNITRSFLSADDRWAGHVDFKVEDSKGELTSEFGDLVATNTLSLYSDLWAAYAFNLKNRLRVGSEYNRIILSGRFIRTDYLRRPFLHSPDNSQHFLNVNTTLLSVGFSRWDYYLDHNVFYLGQAEYFNKGINAALIGGWQYDEELHHRMYTGFQVNHGKYFRNAGYLYSELNYGGFTNFNRYQQVLLKLRESFYSRPMKMGKVHVRQFVTAMAYLGFERPIGRENVLNNNSGLSGVFVDAIRGNSSAALNLETALYPSFKVIGVSSCLYFFADLAITNGRTDFFTQHTSFYQSYGLGLRLRNLEFGWGFIQLSFAYIPQLKAHGYKPWYFGVGYENSKQIPRNNLFKPDILAPDM